jgi:thioredoxin reductase
MYSATHREGGGNSAGKAAVFLSQGCAEVNMLVRGPSLAKGMSRYLIHRIFGINHRMSSAQVLLSVAAVPQRLEIP